VGKLKTHKGLKKRIRVSATGKVSRQRGGHGHLMTGKTTRNKRLNRKKKVARGAVAKRFIRMLEGK